MNRHYIRESDFHEKSDLHELPEPASQERFDTAGADADEAHYPFGAFLAGIIVGGWAVLAAIGYGLFRLARYIVQTLSG